MAQKAGFFYAYLAKLPTSTGKPPVSYIVDFVLHFSIKSKTKCIFTSIKKLNF